MEECAVFGKAGKRIVGSVLGFLVPDACPVCARAMPEPGGDLCAGCAVSLRELPSPRCSQCGGAADSALAVCGECLQTGARPWRHAVSVFAYGGTVRDMVHRLKYGKQPYLAGFLGRRMARAWQAHGTGIPEVVVPVPLHLWRRLRRGYNQAGLLAEQVAQAIDVPVVPALVRARATRRQALLDIDSRKANVKGVFAPRPRWSVAGRHVLLLDDVLTTGHTLGEAARTLCEAGALAVSVLTAARG
ncbi:MAG: ComF family protein [Victivallales bacterium]|nr:ComF family protein [Victivallales bacterium]MBT7165000.1 ComF family protein [Victivallales bacterium]MBT7301185.1 ComF family protein [Victivallales bacterium]